MIEHRITFTDEELRTQAVQNNLPVLALARFLRSLPEDQKGFFKDCRLAALIPVYLPRGDFSAAEHALSLDQDQMEWFLREHPEFLVNDETRNASTVTGRKVGAW
ncbi:hypothetical protein JCM15519_30640 [Fundidesulfovibrio butyratiphilus]